MTKKVEKLIEQLKDACKGDLHIEIGKEYIYHRIGGITMESNAKAMGFYFVNGNEIIEIK